MRNLFKAMVAVCVTSIWVEVSAGVITDFSWIPDLAYPTTTLTASTVLTDGTAVTLQSSDRGFYQSDTSAVVFDGFAGNTTLTMTFSRSVREFRLRIFDLDLNAVNFESLSNFSATPDFVSGNLLLTDGMVLGTADNDRGDLNWNSLNENSVSFLYTRCNGCGLFLEEFEINEVPEPTTLGLFAAGLAGLGFLSRRRKQAH